MPGTALHGHGAHTDGHRHPVLCREAFPHFPAATLSVQLDAEGRNTLLQGKHRHQQCLTAAKRPDESARAIGVVCYQGVGHCKY